ncbi:Interferon-inducible double-stranded RNA-dependent protein kinase activator A -like protein A [Halotydeus destructor]|nr:Interferon-inducible double-stranded RNA-dependent protein kinase activator A -like protein A [Halotydeus destructor]
MDTPISVLQDFCFRNLDGVVPEYNLLSVEGVVHAPTFMYRVQINDVFTSNVGNSKKKAKHGAALSAMRILLEQFSDVEDIEYFRTKLASFSDESQPKKEPQEDLVDSDFNPVGKLQEVCMKKRWRPPVYDTVEEIGLPHERVFTMTCEINHSDVQLKVTGTGKSKKLAKRTAANEMICKLEKMGISHAEVTKSHSHSEKKNPTIVDKAPYVPSSVCAKKKVDTFYEGFGDELNTELDAIIRECETEFDETTKDYCELLRNVGDYVECLPQYTLYEAKYGVACLASLIPTDDYNTPIPVVTGWGSGDNEEDAKQDAARVAVSLFEVTKQVLEKEV